MCSVTVSHQNDESESCNGAGSSLEVGLLFFAPRIIHLFVYAIMSTVSVSHNETENETYYDIPLCPSRK